MQLPPLETAFTNDIRAVLEDSILPYIEDISFDELNTELSIPFVQASLLDKLVQLDTVLDVVNDIIQAKDNGTLINIKNFPFLANRNLPQQRRAAYGAYAMTAITQLANLYPNLTYNDNDSRALKQLIPLNPNTFSSDGKIEFPIHSDTNDEQLAEKSDGRPTHLAFGGTYGNGTAITSDFATQEICQYLEKNYPAEYACLRQPNFKHLPSLITSSKRHPTISPVILDAPYVKNVENPREIRVNFASLSHENPAIRTQVIDGLPKDVENHARFSLFVLRNVMKLEQFHHEFCIKTGDVWIMPNDPHKRNEFEGYRNIIRLTLKHGYGKECHC